jgi:hypothetical protein
MREVERRLYVPHHVEHDTDRIVPAEQRPANID